MNKETSSKEPFIKVYDWMHKELGLKGNELLIFALIYSFCNQEIDGTGKNKNCSASQKYMSDRIGLARQNISIILKKLQDKGLIDIKTNRHSYNVSSNYYSVNFDKINMIKKNSDV